LAPHPERNPNAFSGNPRRMKPCLTEQAAGLVSFCIRSDGSAFLPPTPSCRAVLAIGGGGFRFKYHDGL